ncbi:MAG: EAL domain-containing protein, partial [Spirochaetia bacterium]|nr:EAL domain-containing protein [Spirochaetia bacterium]
SINKSFSAITGYSFSDVHLKNPRVLSSGMMDEDFYADMWNQILEKGYWKGEILNKRKNGEVYPEWLSIATLRNREGQICNFIAIFSDATEYRKREDAIRHMAYHDNLTDLPNRALMEDRIKMEIAHSTRMNNHFAILFLDLDRFKNLNDTFGHTLGDRLLIEVGKRLKGAVRNDDTVSRLGGDEFIIMLRDMTKPQTAAKIAKKILLSISDDFKIENEIFKITPSIGIALYPQDGTDSDELLRNADAAMYHAKDQGRGNYQFFTPELNDLIEERKMIEKALESAVENSEFQLYYQPQISISEKKVVGAEALIRWFHPQMGKVNPSKFISIAEDTGLIHKIGEWVIMEALSQFEKWSSVIPDFEKMTFSINLSVLQLEKENFYNLFKDQISKVSFPHEILEIEITETSLMRNANQISEMLKKLKELNITITIDDFGSGFTSLNHLKKLPVDRIKIDRSFVSDIAEDSNAVYTEAIVRLAQTLDLSIVAEGGENQEQEDMLLKAGCDVVQGFYYSKALSSEDFLLFLNHYNQ